MESISVVLFLCMVGQYTVFGYWYGQEYWNERHSIHGIDYDTSDRFWGIWTEHGDIKDHYFLTSGNYLPTRFQRCFGCSCDEVLETVSNCRGDISLQRVTFTSLTADSFARPDTITSITIINVPTFTEFKKGALDSLTALEELIVTGTGLTMFPDISATAMTKMMLADNALFFSSITPKITWPSSLKRLSLIQNKIVYVPANFFSGSQLEFVALSRNQLKYVPGTSLQGVDTLEFLSVDENHIEGISKTHLSFLADSQLKHLNLSNNAIRYIEPYALAQLDKLLILELHNNELTELRKGVFSDIPNLVHLDLVKNRLLVLDQDSLVNLPSLYTLRLHSQLEGDGMTTIYYNAFKDINGNLTNLWLGDNALITFPHGVLSEQQYDKLANVQISHNRISNLTLYSDHDFPPKVKTHHPRKERAFQLWQSTPNLARLNAGFNALPSVSASDLCALENLSNLNLAGNSLLNSETFVDGTLDCLKKLSAVDLSYTTFSRVPKMTDMPLFRDLRMNHCDLTILEAGIFEDLQLTYVSMAWNMIITVENGVFPSSIIYIVMNCNCFKFTHENPFTNLNQLQYLDLGHNEIDYIPETAFQNCTSLTSLRLHENNIGWLSKEMFKDSPLTSQFYAYDNQISCIEDGTFNHTNQISHFFLHNNKLEKLPTGGDFSSKTMYDLYLYNNRFTELPSGVFEDLNVAHSMLIYGSSITAVRSGAFRNSRFGNVLDLRGNPLNTIETGAFESSTFDTMYLNDMQISHLPTGAFRSVTATYLYLHSNDITHIERAAFQDVHLDVGLHLHDNKLTNLTDPLFSNASSIGGLFDLGHNNISIVASEAFDGLTSVSSLVLNDNSMEYYPTAALANLGLEHINISNNNIRELSLVAFRHQDDLITVNLTGNSITKISKGTLANLFNLQTLLLGYNLISYIEPGSFSGLGSIETIDVSYNNMFFFPAMPNLTSLARIDLSHNQLMTFESAAFDEMELNEAFHVLDLTGNQNIGCDCYMIESLKKIRQVISGGLCGSPLGAINTSLDYSSNRRGRDPTYFVYADPRLFLCSPVDVIASTVTSADVTVTWARPESITIVSDTDDDSWRYNLTCTGSNGHVLHAIISSVIDSSNANSSSLANSSGNSFGLNTTNASNSTGLNTTDTADNSTLNSTASVNTTTVNSTNTTNSDTSGLFSHTFTIDDGVMANTEYICVVAVLDGNANFISSPPSQPGVVRTQRDKTVVPTINITSATNSTNSTNTTNMITTPDIYDWTLPIVYYDFSDTHPDFVGYETAITSRPTYVPSPFETWLSRSTNPSTDSFSSWFVDNPATNIAVESTIKLGIIGTVPPTHRYESDSFFPVDGVGYGDNQKDCFGADHNFGFTSAIRVAFGYQGIENETITVGGGDDLWVYINDILVVEVINRGNDFPCKMINLYLASAEGGSTIIPQAGVIVSGQCVITNSEPTESVFLDLSVGEKYRISIFHAERLTCSSNLYIQTENINFITDPLVDMPSDYVITPPEDFHVNGTLKHLYLADIFSSGPPFNVTVIRGNEGRHFTILDNTAANVQAAVPPNVTTPNYNTVDGISYVECINTSFTGPDEDNNDTTVETFTVNTGSVLFTLVSSLDYEVRSSYTVVMEVVDIGKVPPTTGTITVKVNVQDVNDNCPVLNETNFDLIADPALQSLSIATLLASDSDGSTNNSDITYYISAVVESPALDFNPSLDLFRDVYVHTTILNFSVIAVDSGSPPRGSRATMTLEVDNSCLIDATYGPVNYSLSLNSTTGELYFRAPGYYVYHLECDQALGMEYGHIGEEDITASSFSYEGNPTRARLNFPGIPHAIGSIHGGWTPVVDADQWIQVSLNTSYRITKLLVQGQADEDNWVTSLAITYSSDGVTWFNYSNDAGNETFAANHDRNTIITISLDPEIATNTIRIHPITWHNHVGLRLEFIGCSEFLFDYYRTTCERCLTTNYCVGDGSSLPCGRCDPPQANSTCGRSPTEHSFGLASECTTCPLGWLCKDGYAEPCPEFHYINCTDSDCPDQCYPCEPGYACRKGERFECPEGTYSNGTVARCELCDAGTYQDERGQGSCKACPTGYESSINRQRCDVCSRRTYLDLDTKTCLPCTLWSQCPCIADTSLCYQKTHCHNYQTGPSTYSYSCLPCPDGFTGDGATCLDIDECVVYKPCWNSSTCINTSPGYQCRACPWGYIGTYEDALTIDIHRRTFYWKNKVLSPENQTCTDIDECLVNNGGCDVNAYCHNTIGSFYCGECLPGYIGNPVVGCRIGDFCLSGENNCNVNAACLVTGLGEFRCVCRTGWAGDGIYCGKDSDGDGISDTIIPCSSDSCLADNCQYVANGGQEDNDNDKKGDVCDDDDDNDFIADVDDNCQYVANRLQSDIDGDGRGNDCDNCINDVNYDQSDVDDDGVGDVCDDDIDGDSILNGADNCPYEANLAQTDMDGDTVGDSCDNCKNVSNIGQTDTNQNEVGDSCDGQDSDGDGVIDYMDNCVYFPNSVQSDSDNDGSGDTCDDDIDGDGVLNKDDNCVYVPNPGQEMLIGHQTRGDACVQDMDADGTPDLDDLCPYHKNVATASFSRYFTLDLNPSWTTEDSPEWAVLNKGRDIHQSKSTLKPVALIGKQIFDHVTLTGTTFVDSNEGYGVIGFIIGYQSNRKYYLLTWRHKSFNLIDRGNVKGVQIWLVDSGIAPSTSYAYALYHGCDTAGITTLLWQDPNLTGWELGQGYKWTIEHIPSLGALRVCVDHDNNILVDSGYVLDVSIPGGRLGVFSYNQTGSHWSNLQYHCTQRLNKALHLNGVAYGEIGTFSQLSIEHSFSLETWVYLIASDLTMKQPIMCSVSDDVCLYIQNSTFHIKVGTIITDGTNVIMGDTWTHVLTVYEAQSNKVTIFVDGTNGQTTQDNRIYSIPFLTCNATDTLYLGRDNDNNYFNGLMDEVKIYNTAILDADIDTYWTKFDMTREFKKCILSAHYNMDNQTQTTFLEDKGLRHLDVRLHGNPSFVESTTDYQRFYDSIT